MQSAFGAAPPELLIDNDTGVNATLARLHGKYSEKAEYIEAVLSPSNTKAPLFYHRAAGAIGSLQLQAPLRFTITAKVYDGDTLVDTIPGVPVIVQ